MSSKMEDEEDLDPRIQEELDHLNQSSSDINRLENEIDEARSQYRGTFSESSKNMEQTGRKIRKQIQRARQYYEIKEAAVLAQSEVLRSARQFQTAIGVYRAAKETIALAELSLIDSQGSQSPTAMLSTAWQEMLNHASIRVMEAERDKTATEKEHLRRSQMFVELESKLQVLEKKFKTSIAKARPYFEMKAECELKLKQQKQNVCDLQLAITSAKRKYAEALTRLEDISEEIHEHRRQKILLMFPREPGVGADSDSVCSSISDTCIEKKLFPSLSKSTSVSGDIDEDGDSCSVSSDHEDAFIQDKISSNSFHSSDIPERCRVKPITKTNSLRQATKDRTDTVSLGSRSCGGESNNDNVSLGLRSCGSGSSVDQEHKESLDLITDPYSADNSVKDSFACVYDVTHPVTDNSVIASSARVNDVTDAAVEDSVIETSACVNDVTYSVADDSVIATSACVKDVIDPVEVDSIISSSACLNDVTDSVADDSVISSSGCVNDVTDPVADDSSIVSSACVHDVTDSTKCVMTAADQSGEIKGDELSDVALCREREPGSGSETPPLCTEIYKETTCDDKQEYTSQDDKYVVEDGIVEVLQKESKIGNESVSSDTVDNTEVCG